MDTPTFLRVLGILEREYPRWNAPVIQLMKQRKRDPFRILVGTVLSLRTQDPVTHRAAQRLLAVSPTPEKLLALSEEEIQRLIYPVGFYRVKARNLKKIARILVERYGGRVPDTLEELLALPGVGRKTANLVLSEGFGKPAICVDTHVHRITNRLGFVKTRTPEQTERELRQRVPVEWWPKINFLLVAFGQSICRPIGPRCDACPVAHLCERVGVSPRKASRRKKAAQERGS